MGSEMCIRDSSDVFVPLRNSYWLVPQSISVRVVGLPFYISATFVCVLVIMQKENVLDCLLPRGMFLFVINIFFEITTIIHSVSVLTKLVLMGIKRTILLGHEAGSK